MNPIPILICSLIGNFFLLAAFTHSLISKKIMERNIRARNLKPKRPGRIDDGSKGLSIAIVSLWIKALEQTEDYERAADLQKKLDEAIKEIGR